MHRQAVVEAPRAVHKLSGLEILYHATYLIFVLFRIPQTLVRIKSRESSSCIVTPFFVVLYNLKKKSLLLRMLPQQVVSGFGRRQS